MAGDPTITYSVSHAAARAARFGPALALLGTWGAYFAVLFARMIRVDAGGLWVGHPYAWADWALHLSLGSIFAFKAPGDWFAYHPSYADGRFTYPFLTHLVSGLLERAGLSLPASVILPSIAFSLLLLLGLHRWLSILLGSRARGFLALSLFLLAGGLGFLDWLADVARDPALALPAREYGKLEAQGWLAGSFVTGMLVPQRAFLLGLAMASWALAWLCGALLEPGWTDRRRRRALLGAGVLVGLLPVAHPHSLIALAIATAPLFLLHARRWRLLAWFLAPAALLGGALYLRFVAGGIQTARFASWRPGWTSSSPGAWLLFWLRVWGLALPLAAVGALRLRGPGRATLRALALGFGLLFALGNLVLFQPTPWDNSKLFLYVYLGCAWLCAAPLADLWGAGRPGSARRRASRAAAALGVVALTLTGATELALLQRVDAHTHQLLSREDLELARAVRERTGPRDRFLTAPITNSPISVRGARPVLMAYEGWVWNYGFDYRPLQADVARVYAGAPDAAALLARHRVSYVVVGPAEVARGADRRWLDARFPVAFATPSYRVYDVRSLLR